eukprot:2981292-Rhodomonas_salina.1
MAVVVETLTLTEQEASEVSLRPPGRAHSDQRRLSHTRRRVCCQLPRLQQAAPQSQRNTRVGGVGSAGAMGRGGEG